MNAQIATDIVSTIGLSPIDMMAIEMLIQRRLEEKRAELARFRARGQFTGRSAAVEISVDELEALLGRVQGAR